MSTLNVNKIADASGGVLAPISSVMRNRIINGAMVIDQRNAGASVTPSSSGVYTLDRFYLFNTQASKFSIQQNAGSVTPPVGFNNYAGITSTSAFTPAAGDFFGYSQHIEGFNTADLNWGTANAKTVTFSFWVRSSLTGTFGGFLKNNAGDRFYVYSYTISAANTWEQKTITIAGDTSGTWNTTNGIGIAITWGLGAGATYTGGSASWGGTFYNQPSGSVNLVSTNGATFYITGVQLEVGTQATSFEYRQYTTELQLCQRYCELLDNRSFGLWVSATQLRVYPKYQVRKRATTTANLATTTPYAEQISVAAVTGSGSTIANNSANLDGGDFSIDGFSGRAYGQFAFIDSNTILVTAEL
jgi:hypothetical protein